MKYQFLKVFFTLSVLLGVVQAQSGDTYATLIDAANAYFPDSVALSILNAKEAYQLVENSGDHDKCIESLNLLSRAYQESGQYNESIRYSLDLLRLCDMSGDDRLAAKAYLRIGDSYRFLLQFKDALYFHNLAIEKLKSLNDEDLLSSAYNHLGATNFENGFYDKALMYFQKSYDIVMEKQDTMKLAIIYNSFGIIYSQMENYIEAKDNFLKALEIFSSRGMAFNSASVGNNLGKLYVVLGEYDKARDYLRRSRLYLDENPSVELEMNNLRVTMELYKASGDYENAFNYLQQIVALHDSLRKNEIVQKVEQFRIAYDLDRMEKDLLLSQKQNQIKAKNIRIIIILALLVIVVGILFLILFYSKTKQAHTNLLVSEQEREIAVLKVEQVEEKQRRRKEQYEADLSHKSRELISTTMHIVQKNSLINDIRDRIKTLKLNQKADEQLVHSIVTEIDQNISLDKDWDVFVKHFKDVHPNFFDQLIEAHPNLTSKEIRYCAYSRLNLSLKEIATVLNITTRGVEKARSRIRTKLQLPSNVDLNIYLQSFGKSL